MPRLRVLILEDNVADGELILAELRRAGFDLEEWKRVDSEAGFLEQLTPDWDIIISDYHMPQFGGMRALELLQESGLDIPLIIVSGAVGEETAVAAIQAGAIDYLLKDRLARLGPAVRRALEQLQTERHLRQSRERYRSVVEDQTELVCRWLPDTTLTFVNRAYCRFFDRSRADLLGGRFGDLRRQGEVAILAEADLIGNVTPEHPILNVEHQTTLHTGESRWLRWTDRAIFNGARELVEFQSVGRDITKRKLAEQEREALLAAVPDAMYRLDHEGNFLGGPNVGSDKGFAETFDVVGRSIDEVTPGVVARKIRGALDALLASGQIQSFEYDFEASGEHRYREVRLAPCGRGQALVLLRDVSDRRRAEEARLRLETAIEQAGEMVMITDTEEMIEYVNPAFEKTTGYSKEETLGQTPRILASGEHDQAFYRELFSQITGGVGWQGRMVNRNKDGSLAEVDMSISPVRGAAGVITEYVAVSRDVTAQVALEKAFLQAQKMEAVGRLAGGIAHDFNNLLTAISGYSELILLSHGHDKGLKEDVEEIARAASRAAGLTRQLLAFSHKQATYVEILDLTRVVRDFEKLLARIIGEDVRMQLDLSNSLPPIVADRGQIEQVIVNLAVNARDAMPDGGTLRIATEALELTTAQAVLRPGLEPGPHVALTVVDHGQGMSSETLARIFEPFFTTKGVGKGTGLGLSTVFGIVKNAGGHIGVESILNEGTVFRLVFPVADIKLEAAEEHLSSDDLQVIGPRTILVVEDESATAILIERLLRRLGHRVLVAFDGAEALTLGRDLEGSIDLLLTDVILPGISGPDLAEEFKKMHPGLRVLYMSGYSEDMLVRSRLDHDQIALLQKPFVSRDLYKQISKALR